MASPPQQIRVQQSYQALMAIHNDSILSVFEAFILNNSPVFTALTLEEKENLVGALASLKRMNCQFISNELYRKVQGWEKRLSDAIYGVVELPAFSIQDAFASAASASAVPADRAQRGAVLSFGAAPAGGAGAAPSNTEATM
jgi:hypothetical protein